MWVPLWKPNIFGRLTNYYLTGEASDDLISVGILYPVAAFIPISSSSYSSSALSISNAISSTAQSAFNNSSTVNKGVFLGGISIVTL